MRNKLLLFYNTGTIIYAVVSLPVVRIPWTVSIQGPKWCEFYMTGPL